MTNNKVFSKWLTIASGSWGTVRSIEFFFIIPALCQAICAIVEPKILVWSKSRVDIPQTIGFLITLVQSYSPE